MENIDQEIEKTMNSLSGVQRAVSNPFLHTRIEAKLDERKSYHKWAMAIFYTCLLLAVANVYTLAEYQWNTTTTTVSEVDYTSAFQSEYGLTYTLTLEQ